MIHLVGKEYLSIRASLLFQTKFILCGYQLSSTCEWMKTHGKKKKGKKKFLDMKIKEKLKYS